ncbi:MAG: hypothetical protein NTV43_15900 [Methylococcales bacterium]|nr:hypothetical protein [Methylococcales bacterium]
MSKAIALQFSWPEQATLSENERLRLDAAGAHWTGNGSFHSRSNCLIPVLNYVPKPRRHCQNTWSKTALDVLRGGTAMSKAIALQLSWPEHAALSENERLRLDAAGAHWAGNGSCFHSRSNCLISAYGIVGPQPQKST